eukprot:TRINITY_DN2212_c0_g1_i1.p1 TRINITY_DN2212_c0_g1~~TRINITY_DN2212_c0_g1_i1.p1  ORF type:complete len:519 (-),score=112.26 TRINITY_DN2212_c0_g1_i1:88-1644(-)
MVWPILRAKEEEDSDSYIPKRKGAAQRGHGRAKKPAIDKSAAPAEKAKKEPAPGINLGKWTDEEEGAFLEALELYGRQWDKHVTYIKTRDKDGIKSHAQKHFIRLFKEQKALPDKVKESGAGFTLSGKELDVNSAAARAYGLGEGAASYRIELAEKKRQREAEQSGEAQPNAADATDAKKGKQRKIRKQADEVSDHSDVEFDEDGRTVYAASRPQRSTGTAQKMEQSDDHSHNPLTLLQLSRYSRPPFRVRVSTAALIIADAHAHMCQAEIIGLLAGTFDAKKKEIHVQCAYPCQANEDDAVQVEMAPESELEVRNQIQERGLQVVGWYHSHPKFEPRPSARDVENQQNYQQLFRDASANIEPFIGLIVGPYDVRMLSEASQLTWFHVHQNTPMQVDASVDPWTHVDELVPTLNMLAKRYAGMETKIDFGGLWRFSRPLMSTDQSAKDEPLKRIDKLRQSLLSRLAVEKHEKAGKTAELGKPVVSQTSDVDGLQANSGAIAIITAFIDTIRREWRLQE